MELLRLVFFLVFATILSIYDIKLMQVPIFFLFAQLIVLLIFDFLFFKNDLLGNSIGATSCFLILFATYLLTKRKMGMGDVFYGFTVGWFLGSFLWLPALFAATVFGIIFLLEKRKNTKQKRIPFVPFMSLSSLCVSILYNTA